MKVKKNCDESHNHNKLLLSNAMLSRYKLSQKTEHHNCGPIGNKTAMIGNHDGRKQAFLSQPSPSSLLQSTQNANP